ncbi:flagellum-associated coiled-coil domain-containing protein 1 [Pelobates fuscus]|uniref:flagellum-associated coiled-coil domain-containing protein 1 n=1 Tax=Pelobates fuscus TaxID=191477 RepID=UPI002FE4C18F
MSSCVGAPQAYFVAAGYRHGKHSAPKSSGSKNRPRISPTVCTAFRDPGREIMSLKSSTNTRKWTSPRQSGCRMRSKEPAKSEKEYLVISTGYTMMRSKSHIAVRLEEEFFGGAAQEVEEKPHFTPPRSRLSDPDEIPSVKPSRLGTAQKPEKREQLPIRRENIVEDLQEQIAKLTVLLEQETTEHQKTHRRLTQELEDKVTELLHNNEEEIRNLQMKYAEELLALQQQHNTELQEEKDKAEKKFDKLQKENVLLQSSFRTYQESLSEEMNAEWLLKEAQWKETFENEKLKELTKQKLSLMNAFEEQKSELRKRAQEDASMVQQSYEKKMEETWKKYKETLQESKRQEVLKMLLEGELAEKKETIITLNAEIQQARSQIGKMKSQLDDLRRSFDDKVNKVEAKYNHRIHTLLNENADLRRKLIAKNEQLFSERIQ